MLTSCMCHVCSAGGVYNPNKENGPDTIASTPIAVACPANMTTLGMRSTSNRACGKSSRQRYTDSRGW